jgi:hypothetical protein
LGREERKKAQESFQHDPEVQVLIATDAAGEGINLQRVHLMVNYDLPWNPNRIEQRFGRIHRIGQTEVCHLWNLVADDTREGDVYRTLLEKLEQARRTLGGQVFDVLGKLQFEGRSLRDLLIEAIRHSESPEVRARLTQVIANASDSGLILVRELDERLGMSALMERTPDRFAPGQERCCVGCHSSRRGGPGSREGLRYAIRGDWRALAFAIPSGGAGGQADRYGLRKGVPPFAPRGRPALLPNRSDGLSVALLEQMMRAIV